ncbi:MAG: GspE/PulE family protein [Patescibacteria group bacterium]
MTKTYLDILIEKKAISVKNLRLLQKRSEAEKMPLDALLIEAGVAENAIIEAKSATSGFPIRQLMPGEIETIPDQAFKAIPEESAAHYQMAPLGQKNGYMEIGMVNPDDIAAHEALKFISAQTDMPIRIYIIAPSAFADILKRYGSLTGEVGKALGEFKKEYESLSETVRIEREQPAVIIEDAPITKMFAVILRHAVEGRASDVHIEPTRENVRVRFRVDGALHTSLLLPPQVHSAIVTRIKVLTSLKIDETRIPQDGRFHAEIVGRAIDFRVSTFPTALGEKVAVRILDPTTGVTSLDDLGIEGDNLDKIRAAIRRPYGMILITGPTGSGKSTTLYALLNILNDEKVNIVSLEDPVEYYISGISQSHVRAEIGYTFATGLRHILRQDPDIIMVGEIRDKETAALAVHAALTGHLVLSTLHTNNAVGVIPRLIDMGVDPFLIPATLILAVAQRLVRRLCPDSRGEVPLDGAMKETLMSDIRTMPDAVQKNLMAALPPAIYEPQVSASCPKGTRGRIGLFEMLAMTPELEKIIITAPSEANIIAEAKRQAMLSLRHDGILKVLHGKIGFEDLLETT